MRACVCARARECVCACVCLCVCACVHPNVCLYSLCQLICVDKTETDVEVWITYLCRYVCFDNGMRVRVRICMMCYMYAQACKINFCYQYPYRPYFIDSTNTLLTLICIQVPLGKALQSLDILSPHANQSRYLKSQARPR